MCPVSFIQTRACCKMTLDLDGANPGKITMNNALLVAALLAVANITNAAPVVYTNEASYMSALAIFGYPAISESFEDGNCVGRFPQFDSPVPETHRL